MNRLSISHDCGKRTCTPSALRAFIMRQLGGDATTRQYLFDLSIGIIAPVLCLIFDPIVFRSGGFGPATFGSFQLFAYGAIALEIIALAAWLALGARAAKWCNVIGGVLSAGALFSFIIGVVLLPLSVIGLLFGIGVFGFTPFLVAFVYLRNGRRALQSGGAHGRWWRVAALTLLGAWLTFAPPAWAQWRVAQSLAVATSELGGGDEQLAAAAAHRLKHIRWASGADLSPVVWAYAQETDPARKRRLARGYKEATGEDIETRLRILAD